MKAVTANMLDDGRVVYLGADDQLVSRLAGAALFEAQEADAALARVVARKTEVATVYLIDVAPSGEAAGREAIKETIRNTGPTVRRDLGKQAGAQ